MNVNLIKKTITSQKLIINACVAALLLCVHGVVQSKDYIVEVIIFENTSESKVTEPHAYAPPQKPRTNSQAWLLDTQLLKSQAERIDKSPNYELRHHFAWGQQALPFSQSTTYTVIENDTQGYIKIYADQLLFANIDLDYNGFRMVEKRRLKLNERHFFDHPKFGILLQVSRLSASNQQNTNDADEKDSPNS